MKSTFIIILTLSIMSLCARSSPIPLDTASFRPSSRIRPPSSSALLRRGGPSSVVEEAAAAGAAETFEKKAKDWKRPVVIAISGIGLAMTVGWNYIAFKSFMANREKHQKEQRRLEAERNKPVPRVGDTMCMVKTYSTDDQVAERKPSVVEQPCYVMGQQQGQAGGVASSGVATSDPQLTATSSTVGGGSGVSGVQQAPAQQSQSAVVLPGSQQTTPTVDASSASAPPSISPGVDASSSSSSLATPAFDASSPPTRQDSNPDSSPSEPSDAAVAQAYREAGFRKLRPLNKRGFGAEAGAVEEIVEETTAKLHSPPPLSSTSTSPASPPPTTSDRTALLAFERKARNRATPALSTFAPFALSRARPRPGFAVARPAEWAAFEDVHPPKDMPSEEERAAVVRSTRAKLWSKLKAPGRRFAKIPTDDITFGLTVLNTIGGIPSLMLTIANAVMYRGNPRVD